MTEDGSARVLVVDKDVGVGAAFKTILNGADVDVTAATRAGIALDILMRSKFGLLVVDLSLDSAMSGRKLLEGLRVDGDRTPAIVLFTDDALPDVPTMKSLGVVAYLQKPLDASMVKREVLQVLRPPRSAPPPRPPLVVRSLAAPLIPAARPPSPPAPPPTTPVAPAPPAISKTPTARFAPTVSQAPTPPAAPRVSGQPQPPTPPSRPAPKAPSAPQISVHPAQPRQPTLLGLTGPMQPLAPTAPAPAMLSSAPAAPMISTMPVAAPAPGASLKPPTPVNSNAPKPPPPKPPTAGPDFYLPPELASESKIPAAQVTAPPPSFGSSSLIEIRVGQVPPSVASMPAATPSPAPVQSAMKLGRYIVQNAIASGGMGTVYRALDPNLDRIVAVKVLKPPQDQKPDLIAAIAKRFQREAVALAKLRHPNIVAVFDYGIDEPTGMAYVVMELVEGESLGALIARQEKLPSAQALPIIVQMAEALAYAHDLGIVHRDIKPENVILEKGSIVRLIDFGMARLAESTGKSAEHLLGSPNYLSPELAEAKAVDWRSDQFSLATVLLEMLSGRKVFRGDRILQTVNNVSQRPTPSFRELGIMGTPRELEKLVLRMHEKFPSRRVQDEKELVAGLRAVAATLASYATS